MTDQCVPISSRVTVKIEQNGSKSKKCSVTFEAKMKHDHEEERESSTSNDLGIKRKRRKRGIPAKQKWEIISHPQVPNIKQAHKKAKRRPIVKDKRREIHRQNERFRHQSLNMAIKDLSMLVPHSKHHRTAVKHHVVQTTGQYLEFLNNQVTLMCSQLRITKKATQNCFSFNRRMMAVFDHQEKHHPAGKAITLSSLEGLIDNMHIENRHYNIRELKQREKSKRLMKKDNQLPAHFHSLEARKIPDSIHLSRNNLDNSQESLLSPSHGDIQIKNELVTAGYLGDVELSQSSVKSLSQSQSSGDFSEGSSSSDIADLLTSSTSNSNSSQGTYSSKTTSPSNLSDISEVMPFLTDQEATMRSVEKLQFVEGPPRLVFDSNTRQVLQHVGWVNSSVVKKATSSCKVLGTVCNFSKLSVEKGSSHKDGSDHTQSCSTSKLWKEDATTQSSQEASISQSGAVDGGSSKQRSWINGYQLFVKVNHPHFKKAWPHLQGRDISHLLAQAWNDSPEDVKKIYSEKACTWNQQHKKLQEQAFEQ
ncbi:hypothetical protein HOLleu_08288 [Holothuria leucospilota]|uniref:BHLH domain-containing protein n=1 Tax=Holothuria leucospilota TaxID=206669 RepID=A0A9Q1CII6_HOLLE|nr:hypothetical protein HOLleu_08288 [Holothuria leucospilota]